MIAKVVIRRLHFGDRPGAVAADALPYFPVAFAAVLDGRWGLDCVEFHNAKGINL